MTTNPPAEAIRKVRTLPAYTILPRLARNPMSALRMIGKAAGGRVVRLDLGVFHPYVAPHPDQVQRILLDNAANYLREGMMWRPLQRLAGHGIAGEGSSWEFSRRVLQTAFSGRAVSALLDVMSATIEEAVDRLDKRIGRDEPVDAELEMTRIVQLAIIRTFFGNRIGVSEADRLGEALKIATVSFGPRMLAPFVPYSVPLPGDRAFHRAVRTVDEVMMPVVREARRAPADRDDVVSLLIRARDANGEPLGDRRVRDDLVGMFVGASESTAIALTWLWVALDRHPEVAARLYAEIDEVVGTRPPGREHVPRLAYTKAVLDEVLRFYSVGWIVPRRLAADDVLDGVRVPAGSTVLVSPYLTHHLEEIWERPHEFDPDRFSPERAARRHRFAYLAFGLGRHQCLGSHLFSVECRLIVAALLRRFRPVLRTPQPVEPKVRLTVKPRRRVELVLRPTGT
ncbi:cytochrome P450 [Thermopolyspora sp. NPDC052614]|uniref:cytochrome P450 n=1 Tax=Thermopolyspora sp. NPDC052614 TaxID=3155682 RepID=UPI003448E11C